MKKLSTLLTIISLFSNVAFAETAEFKAERTKAVNEINRLAVEAKMPTGLFGVKWLMTPDEVKKTCPNIKETIKGKYTEIRDCYGKQALVTYDFSQPYNILLMITVSYIGEALDVEHAKIRKQLEKDFGVLPEPVLERGIMMASTKKGGGIILKQMILTLNDKRISQFQMYKSKE